MAIMEQVSIFWQLFLINIMQDQNTQQSPYW